MSNFKTCYWTVLDPETRLDSLGNQCVSCRCICGLVKLVRKWHLGAGLTTNCGCMARKTHGCATRKNRPAEYSIWSGMRKRVLNPKAKKYPIYGGRGISIAERGNDFACFLEDMGPRPSASHSIERRDCNGNYEPSNCYWATQDVQQNNRRSNVIWAWNGRSMTQKQWSRELGVPQTTLMNRKRMGWPVDRILSTPAKGGAYCKKRSAVTAASCTPRGKPVG